MFIARHTPAVIRFLLVTLVGTVSGLLNACAPREAEPAPRPPPNLLLIVLDTLRADHLGCYGYARNTSPRIDALASGATLYRRAVATAPWTVPTHASLFTGMFPFEHGAHTYKGSAPADVIHPLHESHVTLAEVLRNEGYTTAAFVANAGYLDPWFQLNQGFDTYQVKYVWSPAVNQRAFEWLDRNGDEPFFLFLNYMDTHRVYNTTPRPGFLETPAVRDRGALLDALIDRVLPAEELLPEDLARRVIDQYDTAVANVDEAVGALLDKLVAMGLYEQTMIVLTSDHGEYFGEHHLVEHSKDIYQPALEVPLIIKAPGQRTGSIDDGLVSSVDVPRLVLSQFPTELSAKCAGLFPNAPGNHAVVSENYFTRAKDLYNKRWGHRFNRIRTAIYEWPYKYIRSSDGRHELYNLPDDPAELNNLLAAEPQIAARLAARLETFQSRRRSAGGSVGTTSAPAEPDEELLDRLRSLGYISSAREPGTVTRPLRLSFPGSQLTQPVRQSIAPAM